jgi:hypothetical protein
MPPKPTCETRTPASSVREATNSKRCPAMSAAASPA